MPLFTLGNIYSTYAQFKLNLTGLRNPNWPDANQLAIYKHGREFERGTTVKKSC